MESPLQLFSKKDIQRLEVMRDENKQFLSLCKKAIDKKACIRGAKPKARHFGELDYETRFESEVNSEHLKIKGVLYGFKEEFTSIGEVEIIVFQEGLDLENASRSKVRAVRETMAFFSVKNDEKPTVHDSFLVWGKVALINRFYLYPEYRKQGYGTVFLKEIIHYLETGLSCNFVVLKPYPLFDSPDKKVQERILYGQELYDTIASLVLFYEQHNFKTKTSEEYFFQCLAFDKN